MPPQDSFDPSIGVAMSYEAVTNALTAIAGIKAHSRSLSQQVQELLDATNAPPDERRARDRFPIPYTFRLTPIDAQGNLMLQDTNTVVGRDLSLTGIGISHDYDFKFKRAIISLDHPKLGRFAVEAEIVWTRPTRIGLLESGFRLIRTVDGHTMRTSG